MPFSFTRVEAPFTAETVAAMTSLWPRAWDEGDDPPEWLCPPRRDAVLFLAHDGATLVGARVAFATSDATHYSLLCLVARSHRRRGIATRLLNDHVAWARSAGFARILADNSPTRPAMIRLNRRHGFVLDREEIRDGRRHLWMVLALSPRSGRTQDGSGPGREAS